MSRFLDVEARAWEQRHIEEYVGEGRIEIKIAGSAARGTTPYLMFFFKGKRVSRAKAKGMIELSAELSKRLRLRKNSDVCEKAEEMCEIFANAAPGCGDDGAVSWPYTSEAEKDQWRALAAHVLAPQPT